MPTASHPVIAPVDVDDPIWAVEVGDPTGPGGVAWPGVVRSVLVLLAAGGLTWWLVPTMASTTWAGIAGMMRSLTTTRLAALTVLWAVGLVLHSFVLTGSLPGLSRRRALTLNLTGSAVANLLPGGGAAGVAANLVMMRRWSVSAASFTAFTVVSNAWDVAAKLALPAVAVAAVVVAGDPVMPTLLLASAALTGLVTAVAAGAVIAARTRSRRAAAIRRAVGTEAIREGGAGPIRRRLADAVATTRGAWPVAVRTARTGWPRLTAAMVGYLVAQAVLLWACLTAVDAPVTVTAVLAAFAVERLTTLVPITPAGTGLAEAGAVTVLIAMGAAPAAAAAGVLLYRLFTVVLEIPVGAVWLAGWSHLNARQRRTP